MKKNLNIENTKGKVIDIKGHIDQKRSELDDLEQRKKDILDACSSAEGANLDEDTQRVLIESLATVRAEISEKAQEISDEMNDDSAMLEEMAQDIDAAKNDTQTQRADITRKKALLDKFGMGGSLDVAVTKMDDSEAQLDELRSSVNAASQEIRNLQAQAGHL